MSPTGRLYFDTGAPCNDCLLEKAFGNITFGSLNSMALNGTDIQPYAQGAPLRKSADDGVQQACAATMPTKPLKPLATADTTHLHFKHFEKDTLQKEDTACLLCAVEDTVTDAPV